jgi:hypothetical protein
MENPLLSKLCTRCGKNGMECQCDSFHPSVKSRPVLPDSFEITREEAHNLYHFLSHEYISHEFYQPTHDMLKRLIEFIK